MAPCDAGGEIHCDASSSNPRPKDCLFIFKVGAGHLGDASKIEDSVSLTDVPILLKDPAEGGEERVAVGVTSGIIRHLFSLRAVLAMKYCCRPSSDRLGAARSPPAAACSALPSPCPQLNQARAGCLV